MAPRRDARGRFAKGNAVTLRKAIDPYTDSSGGWPLPLLSYGMNFRDYASYGLRQFGGWVREDILPELLGREGMRTYREMLDNSATCGSMMFAIQQAMRKVSWRTEAAGDSTVAKIRQNGNGNNYTTSAQAEADFADTLRLDMSHTWEDFVTEALSMLGYGFSAHEIVYKRRMGPQPTRLDEQRNPTDPGQADVPASKHEDGRIGWRRLPIRGQDTVLKWFFDENGQVRGLTQQPWTGTLIDLPIEKMLLFRPQIHKNNPEGRSILRSAYRSWFFVKRLEEQEAILFERFCGFPVLKVPSSLIDAANAAAATPTGQTVNPAAAMASQVLETYKKIITNVRVNEQMGALLPSDHFVDADGKISAAPMYEFSLETPQHGRSAINIDTTITRHRVEMLMTLLCDFLQMGHEVRGTNNLATVKVDMFYQAIEGWMDSIVSVLNRYALPRIWEINGLDPDLMPQYRADMPQRLDLDGLGTFIKNIAGAGMPLFPDEELQTFLRDAAGLPEITDPDAVARSNNAQDTGTLKRMILAAVAKQIRSDRNNGRGAA